MQSLDNSVIENITGGQCEYRINNACKFYYGPCNRYSKKCKYNISNSVNGNNTNHISNEHCYENNTKSNKEIYVDTILLANNKKCFKEKHKVIDVKAVFSLLINEQICIKSTDAAYCSICNKCIVLKSDFNSMKSYGRLLCKVIDVSSNKCYGRKKYHSTSESVIYALG